MSNHQADAVSTVVLSYTLAGVLAGFAAGRNVEDEAATARGNLNPLR
jgi:hypothetical protein